MATLRESLEDGVLALLAPLQLVALGGAAGGYLKKIGPYNGEFEAADFEDIRRRTGGASPAVLVTTGNASSTSNSAARARADKSFTLELLVISRSFRSREARTRGGPAVDDAADPGIYKIVEDIEQRLFGHAAATGTSRLVPVSEVVLAQDPALCIWRVTYQTAASIVRYDADEEDPTPDLTSIVGRHHIASTEGDAVTGSGDSLTVAAGVVTLVDAGAAFVAGQVGSFIVIEGATTPENDGIWVVTAVPTATSIQFRNPAGVTEAFAGTWRIKPVLVAHETTVP